MRTLSSESNWCADEFSCIDFGDERLNDRFLAVAQRLSQHPEASLGTAFHSQAELKAAYRLFANDSVSSDEIQSTHQVALARRIEQEEVVLAVQDTSLLVYNGHLATKGLGQLGRSNQPKDRGLFLHTTLAVSTSGLPLGVFSHQCWARTPLPDLPKNRSERNQLRAKTKPEDKESIKWIDGLDETMRTAKASKARIITIGDREADYNLLMARCIELDSGFVIRSRASRQVLDSNNEKMDLYSKLNELPTLGSFALSPPRTRENKPKKIDVGVKFLQTKIVLPSNITRSKRLYRTEDIKLSVVELKELGDNEKDKLHWILLTSEPVNSIEDALKIASWYRSRWTIEIYFKTLKSGLKVEDCRLGTADKLFRYISLIAIIGYRVLFLSRVARDHSNESSALILTETEWKTLMALKYRTKEVSIPPPTILEAVKMIAVLGGYKNRKNDPPPGPICIWRGLQAMNQQVRIFEIFMKQ